MSRRARRLSLAGRPRATTGPRWQTVTDLFNELCRYAGYSNPTRLAKVFGLSQQTLSSWKKNERQTPWEITFLRRYAARFGLDPLALIEHYELRKLDVTPGTPARSDVGPLGKLLIRVENCVANEGEGGTAWRAIEAVIDAIEYGKKR